MNNTPAFIIYGHNTVLDNKDVGDRMEIHAVVMHLARHGDDQVQDSLDDGTFENTLNVLHSGNCITMASKSWAAMLPTEPFDSHRGHYPELLAMPGYEALMPTNDVTDIGTQLKCHRCGALCQGDVYEDGCNMCAFDDEEHPYNECDCEISGGFENHKQCLLHLAMSYSARDEGMKVWPVSYEAGEQVDPHIASLTDYGHTDSAPPTK
jgi:hypothetical protein